LRKGSKELRGKSRYGDFISLLSFLSLLVRLLLKKSFGKREKTVHIFGALGEGESEGGYVL